MLQRLQNSELRKLVHYPDVKKCEITKRDIVAFFGRKYNEFLAKVEDRGANAHQRALDVLCDHFPASVRSSSRHPRGRLGSDDTLLRQDLEQLPDVSIRSLPPDRRAHKNNSGRIAE